jgi:hypothetical protein
MREMAQKLINTLLFSFEDLKLSTRDTITILKDTLLHFTLSVGGRRYHVI